MDFRDYTITPKAVLLLVFTLLAPSLTSAAFVFEFEVVSYVTNGDCFGIDFTIPCETFVDDFCLRGPAYFNGQNGDQSQCPLGANSQAVYGVPQTRAITSDLPWPGVFQLLVRALDDDTPLTIHDHLDNIFIDQSAVPSSLYSPLTNFPGANNKVSVNLRYRVNCQQNFYGTTCFEYCVASDDDFEGHYTCDPNGSVICRDGYEHPETFCVDRPVPTTNTVPEVTSEATTGATDPLTSSEPETTTPLVDPTTTREEITTSTETNSSPPNTPPATSPDTGIPTTTVDPDPVPTTNTVSEVTIEATTRATDPLTTSEPETTTSLVLPNTPPATSPSAGIPTTTVDLGGNTSVGLITAVTVSALVIGLLAFLLITILLVIVLKKRRLKQAQEIVDMVSYSAVNQAIEQHDQIEQYHYYDTIDPMTELSTSTNEAYGKHEEANSTGEDSYYCVNDRANDPKILTSQNVAYGDIPTSTTRNDEPEYYVNDGPCSSMIEDEVYGDIPTSTTRNDEQVNEGLNNPGMTMTQSEAYGDTSRQISSSRGTGSLDDTGSIPTTRNEAYTGVSTNTESVDTEETYDYATV